MQFFSLFIDSIVKFVARQMSNIFDIEMTENEVKFV